MQDNTSDADNTFTIDGAPGEHTYETTIEAAVTFFGAPFAGKDWYGLHMADVLRGYVRMEFAAEGSVSAEQVADKLSEQAGPDVDAGRLLRQLEAIMDENDAVARTRTGGI